MLLLEYFNGSSTKDMHISFNTITNDTLVSIVTGYGLDRQDLLPGRRKRLFCIPQHPDWPWGSPSLLTNGYRDPFPRAKAAGHEAEHLPVSSTVVNIGEAIPPLPHTSSWRSA
jgi:hypothetical protein